MHPSSKSQFATTPWSRRSFLSAAAGATLGLASGQLQAKPTMPGLTQAPDRAKRVIFLFLNGGPSHIDTWDPKPQASVEIRNFDPACATSVPGLMISENLPRMAQRMHQVALIRSLSHDGPATHAAGQQAVMTGHCAFHNQAQPYFGSMISSLHGNALANVVLGGRLHNEYSPEEAGQTAAWLPAQFSPLHLDSLSPSDIPTAYRVPLNVSHGSWETQSRYGMHDLGRTCLQARRLIEQGTRVVTINQFPTVLDRTTWDMHANGGRLNSTAADYRNTLCPQLDQALSGLLDDLQDRGLLSETVVAVCGEMGRSPQINCYGGRDHHPGVWSGLLAGGPIRAGQVIGESDARGESPAFRPTSPAEFLATIYTAMGINAQSTEISDHNGRTTPVLGAAPIVELL